MYWVVHPLRPQDFPGPLRCPSSFALGISQGPREISWLSGMFIVQPNTSLLYGYNIFSMTGRTYSIPFLYTFNLASETTVYFLYTHNFALFSRSDAASQTVYQYQKKPRKCANLRSQGSFQLSIKSNPLLTQNTKLVFQE